MVKMHRLSDEHTNGPRFREQWTATESRYRDAAVQSGFRISEINGIDRDDTLPTTKLDITKIILSMEETADSIEGTQRAQARNLRQTAIAWDRQLSDALRSVEPGKDPIPTALNGILGGGSELYATFRRF